MKTRRWKRSADDAISSAHYGSERALLAAELAKRVSVFCGERMSAGAGPEGCSPAFDGAIARFLDDSNVRSSLALRYLDRLHGSVSAAEYEDVPLLAAEARWAEGYLEAKLGCPLVAGPAEGWAWGQSVPAGPRAERLYQALGALMEAEISANSVAA